MKKIYFFRVETPADLPPLSSPVPQPQQLIALNQNLIIDENQNTIAPPKRNTCIQPQNLPHFAQNVTKSSAHSKTDVQKEETDESATLNICLKSVSDENRTTADQRSDFSGLKSPSDTSDVIRELETECDNDYVSDDNDDISDDSSTEDESSVTSCSSSSSSSTLITVRNCDTMMVK